ncbi:MAG: NifU family protein [Bacilli bacterium]|nr:NifU family protein [Bacilli bacterium]
MKKIEDQIIEIIEKIRPFLANDGGDLEFVKFEDGIVYVKMLGNCSNCVYAGLDINDTIEAILTSEIPEVIGVKQYIDDIA